MWTRYLTPLLFLAISGSRNPATWRSWVANGFHGGVRKFLSCTESRWDLSRDIDVTDGQIDEVDEGLDGTESAGAVLDDADDAIEAFGGRIGQP